MESKRQLPPWMLRAEATDKVTNSVSVVKRKGKGSKEFPTETCHPDSTLEVEEVTTCQSKVTTNVDSCLVVKKSKTARSRRKPVKGADDDGDISNKRGRDLEKESHAPPRRKRKAKVLNAVEEPNLSEDELTVDDLISIAKDYVNAEKKKEGQRSEFAECESSNKTTHKDNRTSGDSVSNVNTLVEASSSDLVKCQPSEKDFISPLSTGVLTQDILELFLGPFVKKCSEVKPNPEPVTSYSTEPDYPSSNQTQDGLEGDPIPPVKKKGSLKDRVALM